jgi:NADPH2:quinone reductase
MSQSHRQIQSLVREDGVLEIRLREVTVAEPGPDDVVVRVEAAPINPSDLGLLFGAADMTTARFSGSDPAPVIEADIPEAGMRMMAGRVGQWLPVGNEGRRDGGRRR